MHQDVPAIQWIGKVCFIWRLHITFLVTQDIYKQSATKKDDGDGKMNSKTKHSRDQKYFYCH